MTAATSDQLGPPPVWHLKSNAEYGAPGITAWSREAWTEIQRLRVEVAELKARLGYPEFAR